MGRDEIEDRREVGWLGGGNFPRSSRDRTLLICQKLRGDAEQVEINIIIIVSLAVMGYVPEGRTVLRRDGGCGDEMAWESELIRSHGRRDRLDGNENGEDEESREDEARSRKVRCIRERINALGHGMEKQYCI